jgi:hypothetical protein
MNQPGNCIFDRFSHIGQHAIRFEIVLIQDLFGIAESLARRIAATGLLANLCAVEAAQRVP